MSRSTRQQESRRSCTDTCCWTSARRSRRSADLVWEGSPPGDDAAWPPRRVRLDERQTDNVRTNLASKRAETYVIAFPCAERERLTRETNALRDAWLDRLEVRQARAAPPQCRRRLRRR